MIEAVAFCPQAPALVPEVGRGLDTELGEVRAACRTAIRRAAAQAERIVVVGSADQTRRHEPNARGTFAGFGVPVEVALGSDDAGPIELPSSLTVGGWLLRDALGANTAAGGWSVGPDAPPLHLDPGGRAALIVVGDGSARRSEKAPGHLDPRAAERDRLTTDALRSGEGDTLHAYPSLDDELLVAGSRAWDATAWQIEAISYDAELLYEGAPFGVGYFVATWTVRPR